MITTLPEGYPNLDLCKQGWHHLKLVHTTVSECTPECPREDAQYPCVRVVCSICATAIATQADLEHDILRRAFISVTIGAIFGPRGAAQGELIAALVKTLQPEALAIVPMYRSALYLRKATEDDTEAKGEVIIGVYHDPAWIGNEVTLETLPHFHEEFFVSGQRSGFDLILGGVDANMAVHVAEGVGMADSGRIFTRGSFHNLTDEQYLDHLCKRLSHAEESNLTDALPNSYPVCVRTDEEHKAVSKGFNEFGLSGALFGLNYIKLPERKTKIVYESFVGCECSAEHLVPKDMIISEDAIHNESYNEVEDAAERGEPL